MIRMEDWVAGKGMPPVCKLVSRHPYTGRQWKKSLYTSRAKYNMYAPRRIRSWQREYDLELYILAGDDTWVKILEQKYDKASGQYRHTEWES